MFRSPLKEPIEQELDRLETSRIIKKVTYSEWAAPIMAVPKRDRKIRVCGDYKVTINSSLDVDQYPLPKPDDLLQPWQEARNSLSWISPKHTNNFSWKMNQRS